MRGEVGCVYGQGRFWKGLGHLTFVYAGWILGHFTSHHQITLMIFLKHFSPRRPQREDVEPAGPPERRRAEGLGLEFFGFMDKGIVCGFRLGFCSGIGGFRAK